LEKEGVFLVLPLLPDDSLTNAISSFFEMRKEGPREIREALPGPTVSLQMWPRPKHSFLFWLPSVTCEQPYDDAFQALGTKYISPSFSLVARAHCSLGLCSGMALN
jgi:hypothetical protein